MTPSVEASPGLYIHIPFCQSRCGYCDFAVYTDRDDKQAEYVKTIMREIDFWRIHCPRAFHTIYFGGGTPSRLGIPLWQQLLRYLKTNLDLSQAVEITVEANPESLSQALMELWIAEGVTRISLGVQSFQNTHLQVLDRAHTREKALEAIDLIRRYPLTSWSVDLIYGLPGQRLEDWLENLEIAQQVGAPHLSFYNLIQHPNLPTTRLMTTEDPDERKEVDAELFLETVDFLSRHDYEVYELSNAAKTDHACKHNMLYWLGGEWLGLGLSAWSSLERGYFSNPAAWQPYMETWKSVPETLPVFVHRSTFEASLLDRIMLRLRLATGLSNGELTSWVGQEAFTESRSFRKNLIDNGYLRNDPDRVALTPRGWLLHSEIVTRLMQALGF